MAPHEDTKPPRSGGKDEMNDRLNIEPPDLGVFVSSW